MTKSDGRDYVLGIIKAALKRDKCIGKAYIEEVGSQEREDDWEHEL